MTPDEINALVSALSNVLGVLRAADPADKAMIYGNVGLRLTYQPNTHKMIAEATPPAIMYDGSCPEGDLNPSYIVKLCEDLTLP